MGWVVRFSVDGSPAATEIIGSQLWDLGTTGLFETEGGASGAGFDSRQLAETAARRLESVPGVVASSIGVERAAETMDWSPNEAPRPVTADTGGGPLTMSIAAGATFGHGGHPTTAMALDLVLRTVEPGHRVLDVGTGSGILAIAAARAGATTVAAIDNDPQAIVTAADNAARNGVDIHCADITVPAAGARWGPTFDVVAINVLLPVHRLLAGDVLRSLGPGGRLITTGYLGQQGRQVLELYPTVEVDTGLASVSVEVVEALTDGDWAAHLFRIGGASRTGDTTTSPA